MSYPLSSTHVIQGQAAVIPVSATANVADWLTHVFRRIANPRAPPYFDPQGGGDHPVGWPPLAACAWVRRACGGTLVFAQG